MLILLYYIVLDKGKPSIWSICGLNLTRPGLRSFSWLQFQSNYIIWDITCCTNLHWQKTSDHFCKCYLVQCSDKECTNFIVTRTPWQRWYTRAATTVQQKCRLDRKTDSSLVEEEAFLNTYMSRRKQIYWSWISSRVKPGIAVLVKASRNLTDRSTARAVCS
jgi:hypothetical protein